LLSVVNTDPAPVSSAARFARSGFAWVASVAVEVEGGRGWREAGELFDDLYAGTAGVLLACAEAHAHGLELGDLPLGARDRLLHLVEVAEHSDLDPPLPDGLFDGWAGLVVALQTWADVADDEPARTGATRAAHRLATRVLTTPLDPPGCTDIISGDAGILLALLPHRSAVATEAANHLADRLVSVAEPASPGVHWRMTPAYERLMPGFSHGTAGVAYALARASRRLDRPDLLDLAVQGADTIIAVGTTPTGWAVPLTIPPQPDRPPVNFGWCHGPAGTIRLFLALAELDPQPRWTAAIEGCLQALRDSRLPARLYPGYWDNLGRCCGTASVGRVLVDRYATTGDPALLAWVDVLAADVMDRAVTTPTGVAWSNTEHTVTPPDLPPEPGFMQGAAGIAAWLATVAAAHEPGQLRLVRRTFLPGWI